MHRFGVSGQQAHDEGIDFGTRVRVQVSAEEVRMKASNEMAVTGWPTRCRAGIHWRDEGIATVDCAERRGCPRHVWNTVVVALE